MYIASGKVKQWVAAGDDSERERGGERGREESKVYRFIQIAAGLPVCSIRVLHEGEMFFAVFVCDLSAPETSSSLVNARLKCSTTSTGSSFLTLYIGHASLLTPSGCWVPHPSLGLRTVRPSGSGLLKFSRAQHVISPSQSASFRWDFKKTSQMEFV